MCRTLDVSRSGYYYFISRKPSQYALRRAAILREIIALHEAYPTLGLRPLHALVCEKIPCSKNTVHSLMQQHHIHSIRKRWFHCTTNSNHSLSISPNLLQQNFLADSPNSIWVGDITYIPTDEGWLYAAIVKDLFTRQVVGYACSSFIDATLVSAAFLMAVRRHKPSPRLIFHSDRGNQYCSHFYRELLSSHNIVSSMSRRATPMIMLLRKAFSIVSNVKWFIYIILKHGLLQNLWYFGILRLSTIIFVHILLLGIFLRINSSLIFPPNLSPLDSQFLFFCIPTLSLEKRTILCPFSLGYLRSGILGISE